MVIDKLHMVINKRINVDFFPVENSYREKIPAVIDMD